uniref:Uncharacterized protein n=1 Tax=Monodelphis domestica TaxID=13616 RepID=A0A5F8G277_MONDO
MAPTLCALLCFMGLCWCRLTWAQEDASRRPSLTAEPGLVIPRGQPVSFRCQGPPGTKLYRLKEELRQQFMDLPAAEGRGLFSVETAPNTAGNYSCQYKIQTVWSEPSNTLQLVVTGLYEPPSLSALPGPNVTAGQNVTLRCQTELWFSSAALAKDGETVGFGSALHTGPGSRTDFLLAAVSDAQQGRYRCYSFHGAASAEWSSPSAPVELRLTGFTSLKVGILVGVSAFLVLTFLFLSLRRWCPSRLGKGGRDTEVKTARRPDPARTTPGETMFAAVSDDRQAEEARQEDTALQREGPQEVTYAQLDHKSLKRGAEPPPPSGPVEPSVYAVLPPVSSA